MGPILTFVPKGGAVKAFQIPDGTWIVLSADLSQWEQLSDADFQSRYQPV